VKMLQKIFTFKKLLTYQFIYNDNIQRPFLSYYTLNLIIKNILVKRIFKNIHDIIAIYHTAQVIL
jgi:hypothetical protein